MYSLALLHEGHLDQLDALQAGATPYPWSKQQLAASLQQHIVYGLWQHHTLQAFAVFQCVADELTLLYILVGSNYQHQGQASYLLSHCLDQFADCEKCFLEVRISNLAAIALYQKLGFQLIGTRNNYYPIEQGGREAALIMAKVIQVKS